MQPTQPGGDGPPEKHDGHSATDSPMARERSYEELLAEHDGVVDPLDQVGPNQTASTVVASDDDSLEDLLNEMTSENPETVRARVRGEAQRLLDSLTAGANADRGSAPQGPGPQQIVPHHTADETLFNSFGPAKVGHLVEDITSGGIVQLIIAQGGLGLTAPQLAEPVATIKKRYLVVSGGQGTVADHEPYALIITAMVHARPKLELLCRQVGETARDLPLPQASALFDFLAAYPGFWGRLSNRCRITLNSRKANGRGGGLYEAKDGMIYISSLPATPPGAFIRLVIHETGHAMFEHDLLGGHPMPVPLYTYDVATWPAKFDPLKPGEKDDKVLTDDSRTIQELQDYWDGMSAAAKQFYHAWLTLQQHREHLLCLDLWQDPNGNRLWSGHRRTYQAGNFSEFCAEVFMLYAMGDLHPYLVTLLADGLVHHDVKVAWRNAWHVLEAVAAPILGNRAG